MRTILVTMTAFCLTALCIAQALPPGPSNPPGPNPGPRVNGSILIDEVFVIDNQGVRRNATWTAFGGYWQLTHNDRRVYIKGVIYPSSGDVVMTPVNGTSEGFTIAGNSTDGMMIFDVL